MPLPPGSRLGPYEVLALIGAGGMGEVYRARDPRLNREVAIKVLPADRVADPDRRRRFVQEAQAASALNHPHIVTIHEIESADGNDFIVMEYVRGKSLDDLIPAAGHAPQRGAAHRDSGGRCAGGGARARHHPSRPQARQRRWSGTDGAVKVLDFGLAKLLYEDVEAAGADGATRSVVALTEPGVVRGTLAYMAPEQAAGDTTDARSDIFSFGAMLYEMVTGQRAFAGKSAAETLELVLQARLSPPRALTPALPPDLERVILRCLRKDPARRFQAMADLRVDLLEIKEEHDSGKGPQPSPSPHRRGWGAAKVAAVVALAAVLAAGAGWMLRGRSAPSQPRADAPVPRALTRLTFDGGLQTDVTWSPDGRSIAYTSDKSGNFDIWVQSIDTGDARQVTKSPAHDRQPTWSPNGNTIVFRSDREGGGLFAVPAGGGAERRLTSFGVRPRWAPDGSRVLFAASDLYLGGHPTALCTVRLDGKQPLPVLQTFLAGLGIMRDWNWYPDASRVSVLGDENQGHGMGVYTVPLSGDPAVRLNGTTELGEWNAFGWASPTMLFVDCDNQDVHTVGRFTVDPTAMRVLAAERVTTGDHWEPRLALSLDGRRLAFTTTRMSLRLWASPFDSVTGRITGRDEPVTDADAYVESVELTRDGTKVAYLRRHPGSERVALWTTDLATGKSRELARDDQHRDLPAWSPDGSRLAYRWFARVRCGKRHRSAPHGYQRGGAHRNAGSRQRCRSLGLVAGRTVDPGLHPAPQDWARVPGRLAARGRPACGDGRAGVGRGQGRRRLARKVLTGRALDLLHGRQRPRAGHIDNLRDAQRRG